MLKWFRGQKLFYIPAFRTLDDLYTSYNNERRLMLQTVTNTSIGNKYT